MQEHNRPRAISLAQVESSTRVFANVQQPTAFAREERRDSLVSAREYHVRQHARPRPLDDGVAEWGSDDSYRAEAIGSVGFGIALALWATFAYCVIGML